MKKMIKRIFFVAIIVLLVLATGLIIKTGKFEKLEGYMYSFAKEISNAATDCNATSSDATSSNATSSDATSSNATSSNATSSDATSSNATSSDATSSDATSSDATSSNATSSDATSSNATSSDVTTETIKVTNKNKNKKPKPNTNKVEKDEEELEEKLEYNNSKITEDILEKISKSKETKSIVINVDDKGNIKKDVFDSIKGKKIKLTIKVGENEIIFNGNNISTTKAIDPTITYNLASEDGLLKEIVDSGIVINFANNGVLPGTAKVRIKATNDIKTALDMDTIFVYHYNEKTKELTQLTSNAIYNKKEGYIEFSINHNSKYLFVNNLIQEKEYTVTTSISTSGKKDNEVSFLESHKMYVIIIGMSVLAIVIVSIIVVVDKKAIAKRKIKANNEKTN